MIHRSMSKTLTLRQWRDFQTPIFVARDWQTLGGSIGDLLDRAARSVRALDPAATNLFGTLAGARSRCTIIARAEADIKADSKGSS